MNRIKTRYFPTLIRSKIQRKYSKRMFPSVEPSTLQESQTTITTTTTQRSISANNNEVDADFRSVSPHSSRCTRSKSLSSNLGDGTAVPRSEGLPPLSPSTGNQRRSHSMTPGCLEIRSKTVHRIDNGSPSFTLADGNQTRLDNGKPVFASSSFYDSNSHPTIEDQVRIGSRTLCACVWLHWLHWTVARSRRTWK